MGINQNVPAKIIWWNAMPDQDYWIVDWKVDGLVRWSGAGSVRNLAFLDLIVKKSMSLLLGLPNTQPNAQTGSSPRQEIHQGFSGIV